MRRIRLLRRESRLLHAAALVLVYTIELYEDDANGLLDSDRDAVNNLRKAMLPYARAGIFGIPSVSELETKLTE